MSEDRRYQATKKATGQFQVRGLDVSGDQIAEIVREARCEAFAEAKAIIKEAIVQAILEQARREVADLPDRRVPADEVAANGNGRERKGEGAPLSRQSVPPAYSQEQIRREMEAIQRKIVENEALLGRIRTSSTEAAEGQVLLEGSEEDVAPEGAEGGCGVYLYGIALGDGREPSTGLPEGGMDPAYPVYALPPRARDPQSAAIHAIVSRVSLQEFGQEALEANMKDEKWLEAKVYAHQGVLVAASASRPLIPMRFCTIFQGEGRVQEMLYQHCENFAGTLARLRGKQEWGIKAYCDGVALGRKVGEGSEGAGEIRAEMDQTSRGAAYFLRKKLEETLAEEVGRISQEYAQRSHDRLSGHAERTAIGVLQDRELTGRQEVMVLNGAYLVAEGQLGVFRAELKRLEEEYGESGFSYEMTGPWPPYNFVDLNLEEGGTDE